MDADIVLISVIIFGFMLCAVYFYVEYQTWRWQTAKDMNRAIMLGKLHADRMIGSTAEPGFPGVGAFCAHPSVLRQSVCASIHVELRVSTASTTPQAVITDQDGERFRSQIKIGDTVPVLMVDGTRQNFKISENGAASVIGTVAKTWQRESNLAGLHVDLGFGEIRQMEMRRIGGLRTLGASGARTSNQLSAIPPHPVPNRPSTCCQKPCPRVQSSGSRMMRTWPSVLL